MTAGLPAERSPSPGTPRATPRDDHKCASATGISSVAWSRERGSRVRGPSRTNCGRSSSRCCRNRARSWWRAGHGFRTGRRCAESCPFRTSASSGSTAAGVGPRVEDDLLAATGRVERGGGGGRPAPGAAEESAGREEARLVAGGDRLLTRAGGSARPKRSQPGRPRTSGQHAPRPHRRPGRPARGVADRRKPQRRCPAPASARHFCCSPVRPSPRSSTSRCWSTRSPTFGSPRISPTPFPQPPGGGFRPVRTHRRGGLGTMLVSGRPGPRWTHGLLTTMPRERISSGPVASSRRSLSGAEPLSAESRPGDPLTSSHAPTSVAPRRA